MPLIIHIETATNVCSVALAYERQLLSLRESTVKKSHATVITKFIDEVLTFSNRELSAIDAIAVSMGPGSYTGLRIGVATAKGLCYALDKPLIAIPTLQAMAYGIQNSEFRILNLSLASGIWHPASDNAILICPMIDARRMEVYYALYDTNNKEVRETRAEIIGSDSFSDLLKDHKIFFGGDGSGKCREMLKSNKNAIFIDDLEASAKFMISLAEEKFERKEFEDLAYFEPFYLKDFIAPKAKVKGLH
jgi:tRNA threonylcarbamoyladenosine biosynthesis protein TsaB